MVEHYYIKSPRCKKEEFKISEKVLGVKLELISCSGVYSSKKIDKGSIVHLSFAKIGEKDNVLDLGCGYGTVGIIVSKRYPKTKVWMSDINERAVEYAKKNAKINKVKPTVLQSDGFENISKKDFDVILFNPPIQAGLKICYKLIGQSFKHLKKGGTLQVVLRQRGGGQSLLKKMNSVFGNLKFLGRKGIFEVYLSKKNTDIPFADYEQKMFEKA